MGLAVGRRFPLPGSPSEPNHKQILKKGEKGASLNAKKPEGTAEAEVPKGRKAQEMKQRNETRV